MSNASHEVEIKSGGRFRFGENWARFLATLNEARINTAEASLKQMLEVERLDGKTFIDVGSGSGLFSLAARRLGAKVYSFDYDPQSVDCTRELKSRYFADDPLWAVSQGSVLDADFLSTLGRYDIVYSWGVLHHTGDMWRALELVSGLVVPGGRLFIAIYNDQGATSRRWLKIKKTYCSGALGRLLVKAVCIPYFAIPPFILDLIKLRDPTKIYREYYKQRGMSRTHDWYDWLGGYPFEVAKPEEIFNFYREKDFRMQRLITCGGGLGCNQFVFSKPVISA